MIRFPWQTWKEAEWYPVVRDRLAEAFRKRFGDAIEGLHLEVTGGGKFSEKVKSKISPGREIIFSFLGSAGASPDITGFIDVKNRYNDSGFVVVEFKKEVLKLDDVYQARKYGELFDARYAFLVSMAQIPEEVKRLSRTVPSLLSLDSYRRLTLVWFSTKAIYQGKVPGEFDGWFPEDPFAEARA